MSIWIFFKTTEDPDRARCNVCNGTLKIDNYNSNMKKHLERRHHEQFEEFKSMVKAEKEKAEAIEKAEGENIKLKSQEEFVPFEGDVSLENVQPSIHDPSSSSDICPYCEGKFSSDEDVKAHLPICQKSILS